MNSVVLFCILVALATTLVASVRAIDVSVLGVPGTFHAPSGVSCGGSDLTRIGACPGPQPRLEFGSCCQALPNRPLLVLGCVPRLATTSGCVVTTLPPTITRRVDQCAAAELPPIHPGAQPSPTHAWIEVPNSCRPEGRSSSIGLGQLNQWVDTVFRAVRPPASNMRLPWVDVPDTASVAVLPLPTPPSEPEPLQATPRPWYKRSVCAVCGVEASCYVTLYREPGPTKELRCWICSSLWV
ncbi:hypothetical protein DYB34_014147 [Aphanomyces astaci]|uniref:Uncharacterized protein n=1 Tax=Aphanomyces astaci TaxID=112090 RepID=A0A3R6ZQ38_APHAT|nr:hypothetical protein DYB34_014147 [Aphanomyces astaci]